MSLQSIVVGTRQCRVLAYHSGTAVSSLIIPVQPELISHHASSLLRHRPRSHFTQSNGHGISHVNSEPENFLGPTAVFWVKKLQFHIPTVAIQTAERAFSTSILSSSIPLATASAKVEAAWKALVAAKLRARSCAVWPKFRKSK